ncbi:asparaginase [Jatrophihabitans sp. GAS493]|uniref:asparaginase n=1 Tax=Jatrophihabitans sp. GAS493 TaxID=1907575 RepID=UPI000BB8CBEB|nr:asparaginase [Jatrophihabitans sp. GAS493]SOD71650.1 asparaginase [Jatrophihabitans sp. GAS493]
MIRLSSGVPLVEVERSGVVESVHTGHLVVLAPDGSVRAAFGDPTQPFFPRSANKPMQAAGLQRLGLELTTPHRALSSASHSGEAKHVEQVEQILGLGGLTPDDLGCPPDWPLGEAAHDEWLISGGGPTRIRMNCSGKHSAMLLTCQQHGWPLEGYLDPAHPLQVALAETVAELAGEPIAGVGVDGCGAPVFALSLVAVARAFARIATAASDSPEYRVAEAIRSRPDLIAGTGRSATRLMEGIPALIAKDGAEAIFAAALPDGTAIALKIDDGAPRAADRAVVTALRLAGVEAAVLDELERVPLLGGGLPVGEIRAIALR